MRITKFGSVCLALTLLTGCAGMTNQQQKEVQQETQDGLAGGAVGAAGGATIGAIVGGSAAVGAAVLGPAGIVAGLLYYDYEQNKAHSKNGQAKEK